MLNVLPQRHLQCVVNRAPDGKQHLVGADLVVDAGESGAGVRGQAHRSCAWAASKRGGEPEERGCARIEPSGNWIAVNVGFEFIIIRDVGGAPPPPSPPPPSPFSFLKPPHFI